jgi:hypothetical protein
MQILNLEFFFPALARSVLLAKSKEFVPLTIWVVDNSSSMFTPDGKRLLETNSQHDVRVAPCTRWEELKETVLYHAQLMALLEAPTKFILLNKPSGNRCSQELSIAERGSEWVQEDLEEFMTQFPTVQPSGVTPLTQHLRRIYQSILPLDQKIVLVLATDGRPTDQFGYSSQAVDRDFADALQQIQSKAWVVIRLCTNEESIINYYQQFDDQLELSVDILDDYLDEAKEVHSHNPWLTYSLCLHRCREMGMSCHSLHRWLDWLDERSLTKNEIVEVLQILGIGEVDKSPQVFLEAKEWASFCKTVASEQQKLSEQNNELMGGSSLQAFKPWNPIKRKATHWIDTRCLQRHGSKSSGWYIIVGVAVIAIVVSFVLDSILKGDFKSHT